MDKDQRRFSRRMYLGSIASCTAALTAGCLGSNGLSGDGISSSDIPDFSVNDEAQPTPILLAAKILDDEDDLVVFDDFTAEIAIGNIGGSTIGTQEIEIGTTIVDDSGILDSSGVNEPDSVSVAVTDIDSGDWETIEVDLRTNAQGLWTIGSDIQTHPEYDFEIDISSRVLKTGESYDSDVGDYSITALEPVFEPGLHYDAERGGIGLFNQDTTGLVGGGNDSIVIMHRIEVEATNEDRSIAFNTMRGDNNFRDADVIGTPTDRISSDDLYGRSGLSSIRTGDESVHILNNAIEGGDSVEMFALQEVGRDEISDAKISLSLWGDTEDITIDTVEEDPDLPEFELEDISVNTDNEDGDPVAEVTVTNTGQNEGTFRGIVEFYHGLDVDWVYVAEGLEANIESGEQATVTTPLNRGDDRFRVQPFGEEFEI